METKSAKARRIRAVRLPTTCDKRVSVALFDIDETCFSVRLTGTKIGCNEGGCGACTVVLGEFDPRKRQTSYRSVNACLFPVCAAHHKQVITVEGVLKVHNTLQMRCYRHRSARGTIAFDASSWIPVRLLYARLCDGNVRTIATQCTSDTRRNRRRITRCRKCICILYFIRRRQPVPMHWLSTDSRGVLHFRRREQHSCKRFLCKYLLYWLQTNGDASGTCARGANCCRNVKANEVHYPFLCSTVSPCCSRII